MDTQEPGEDLTYIKYSAKEILFHLTAKVEALQSDVNRISANMVTREELASARRWAVSATIAAVGSIGGLVALVLRAFGV